MPLYVISYQLFGKARSLLMNLFSFLQLGIVSAIIASDILSKGFHEF
jgi:hypothetical protein